MITLQHYLILSVILFVVGSIGVVVRRNMLVVIMSMEVMLAGACLAVLAFSRWNLLPEGKVIVVFIISIAIVQVVLGLALASALYQEKKSISLDKINALNG